MWAYVVNGFAVFGAVCLICLVSFVVWLFRWRIEEDDPEYDA